ncbi:MAG TPA: putative PEP-binding protein [Segetibacter sp.]|nr:putative PEP-binding protein [Segetibacter sp.]
MNRVIAALDALKLSESTLDYSIYAAKEFNSHIVAAFLGEMVYHARPGSGNEKYGYTDWSEISEKDDAVKKLISTAIKSAKNNNIKIGLYGQAPSDMRDFAQLLIEEGINSISFNPDALLTGIDNMLKAEDEINKKKKEMQVSEPVELEA